MNYRPLFMIIALNIVLLVSTIQASENTAEIDVYFLSGPYVISPMTKVINIGDEAIHNVRITNVSVQGNILFNNRESTLADVLEPSEYTLSQPTSLFLGYGLFPITITVDCNEGTFITDETNGFIIGWFLLIP